jgi:uncharacterized membrane protein YhaH (DUF805 family)
MLEARRPLKQDTNRERFSWAIEPLRRFADFRGRSPRKEYWMFWALTTALSAAVWAAEKGLNVDQTIGPWGPVSLCVTLALLVPSLALAVRRLHDADHGGWNLLLLFVPLVGWVRLIYLLAQKGTGGANSFGPAPA